MSDEVNVAEDFNEQVSADLIKAAADADLVDAGTYRFQVESYESHKDDKEYFDEEQKERNPWYGKTRYNLRMSLTSKRDGNAATGTYSLMERPRTFFQRVSNVQVLNAKGNLSMESKLFGQMAGLVSKATGSVPTVKGTIDWFMENAAAVTITKTDPTDKYPDAKNFVQAIKAIQVSA